MEKRGKAAIVFIQFVITYIEISIALKDDYVVLLPTRAHNNENEQHNAEWQIFLFRSQNALMFQMTDAKAIQHRFHIYIQQYNGDENYTGFSLLLLFVVGIAIRQHSIRFVAKNIYDDHFYVFYC